MNYTTALVQLPLVREASSQQSLRTPAEIASLCVDMQDLAQEAFHILTLNTKNRLLNRHLITLGLVDSSLVHPREVFRAAITDNAAAIVLSHNHPSGDPQPSAEDIRITKQLIDAGKILGIRVLDHVIIGRHPDCKPRFCSLREVGLCDFA